MGFSGAASGDLYLPVDPSPDAPTVAGSQADPESLWHSLRRLIALRKETPAFRAGAGFEVYPGGDGRVFAFHRYSDSGNVIVAVNPSREEVTLPLESSEAHEPRFTVGEAGVADGALHLGPQSFAIL